MAQSVGILIDSYQQGLVTVNSVYSNSTGGTDYEVQYQTPANITVTVGTTVTFEVQSDYPLVSVDMWPTSLPTADITVYGSIGELLDLHANTPGTYYLQAFARNSQNYWYTSNMVVKVVGAPSGLGIDAQNAAINTRYTDLSTYAGYNNLPQNITVQTGDLLTLTSSASPGPLSNFNWRRYDSIPLAFEGPNGQSTKQLIFSQIGSGSMDLQATNDGLGTQTALKVFYNVVWGKVDNTTLRYVNNLVEGWESLPAYNVNYAGGLPIDTSVYKGWSAAIAAADQLDYFRRKQPAGAQWYPDYIGKAATYDYMSLVWNWTDTPSPSPQFTETFGYPAWRRFTLDSGQSGNHTLTQPNSWDNADFGWWMNTSNLGWLGAVGTNNGTYRGTTVKGLYDGLNAFYNHVGHPNVVFGMLKRAGSNYGVAPPEYVSGAETNLASYEQMVQNLINNDKPFLILLSGNLTDANAPVYNTNNAMVKIGSYWDPSTQRRIETIVVNTAIPGATYTITCYSHNVNYVATSSDDVNTIAAGISFAVNTTTVAQWMEFGGPGGGNNVPGFPPNASQSGNVITLRMNQANSSAVNVAGPPFSTQGNVIYSSALNPNVGPEYIRNITGRSLYTANGNFLTQNDDSSSPLTPIDPIPGIDVNQITGNAYIVIGYCKPTANTTIPSIAANKFLLICKETGGDRNQNIFLGLDTPLTSTNGDSTVWDRLLGTYTISPLQTTYVSPRPVLQINPAYGQQACIGVPITLVPPISQGTPHDNRYYYIYNGIGQTLRRDGNVVNSPQTFNSVGTFPITYKLTDAVSHVEGSYNVVVNPSQNPQFAVTDNFGTSISGVPLHIATGQTYVMTPTAAINPTFNYTWSIVRTDAPGAPGDYTFVQGNASTAGTIKVQFNTAGQYNISLTTTGTTSGSCPGQYTLPAQVDLVTLDFTYTTPTFFGLQVNFNGTCNVAVSNWAWTFGDGGTGNGQVTNHTYFSIGSEVVTLTVTTLYGLMSVTHTLDVFPASAVADFIYSPLTNIVVGESVLFTDLSTPQPTSNGSITATWNWDFGDGNTSTAQNPSHAYSAPGIYNVTLTYTIFFGNPQLSRSNSITKQLTVASGSPVVKSQTFIVSRNLIDTYDLSKFTTSSNPIVYTIDKMPANGDLDTSDPIHVRYQPNTNYVGPDIFTFRATDNFGLFTTGNVNLIVRPPELQVIVGEIISDAGIITIRLGTAEINALLLKEVIIRNTGTGKLVISNMTITDDTRNVFSLFDFSQVQVLNFVNVSLDPKDSFAFYVGILASQIGTYTAKLQIIHN